MQVGRRTSTSAGSDTSLPDGTGPAVARLFAIFWLVTVLFFSVAAYKRRAYLLPLWPVSAFLLAWWSSTIARSSRTRLSVRLRVLVQRLLRPALFAICAGSILFNLLYLPGKPIRDCGGDSFRTTATAINRIVGRDEPLYSYKLGDEPAALIFYLDRNAPPLDGKLGDAPPGYLIVPAAVWRRGRAGALDLTPVYESTTGRDRLILLRHGPALAMSFSSRNCGRGLPPAQGLAGDASEHACEGIALHASRAN